MSNPTKFFMLFITGLIITAAAASGVESAETTQQLVASVFTAGLGLLSMYLATVYANKD